MRLVSLGLVRVAMALLLLALAIAVRHTAAATQRNSDQPTALATVNALIAGIEHGDIERVMSTFADDATVFFPGEPATRATGESDIRRAFVALFAQRRQQPPIRPINVQVQSFGETAVVTAHLERPSTAPGVSRRTFVLRRSGETWRVVHLHASNIEPMTGRD